MPQRINYYELIPAFHRMDDDPLGSPLKKLTDVLGEQANLIQDDIAGLWDDFFIETCAEWAIPYLGDLVANRALHEAVRGRRADVAKTIYYRRRKGTVPMLEELARDVTGWGAHVVPFFEQLGWTQNLNHIRRQGRERVGTAHVRSINTMDLVDTPFDLTTHTVDVRRIRRTQGWYNIRNIGFFLWRLTAYPVVHTMPRPEPGIDYGFHFDPYRHEAPLFTRPQPELSESGLVGEIHVPGPIRALAFGHDIAAYYGEGRSVALYSPDPTLIPVSSIVCLDLSQWERPPAGVSGLWSANLGAFAGLGVAPEVRVTVAGEGPIDVQITLPAATLPQAAAALQSAIRHARTSRAFEGVRVLVVGNRLLVLPGVRGAAMTFASTAGDAVTVVDLGLNATTVFRGLMSGDLSQFSGVTAVTRQLRIRIGGVNHVVGLGPIPHLAAARTELENAVQSGPNLSFNNAQVLDIGHRLLVIPGVDGDVVVMDGTSTDGTTVEELRLASKVGIDVHRGRLAFPIGGEPVVDTLRVTYNYGFSADIGGGPYERRRKQAASAALEPGNEDTVRYPEALGSLIRVPEDQPTLAAAVTAWNALPSSARVVIQLNGDLTHASSGVAINLSGQQRLHLQAGKGQRSVLLGNMTINAVGGGANLRIDGCWIEGQIHLTGDLKTFTLAHCRINPTSNASILADASNEHLSVMIDHSITGPIVVSREAVDVRVEDSIVDSPARDALVPVPAIAGAIDNSSPAPNATILRTTILGTTFVRELMLASEVIFLLPAIAERRQSGCVRFSYVAKNSTTPRRYRCQPNLALEGVIDAATQALIEARLLPTFTSTRFGDPGYGQLSLTSAEEIKTGAEDGAEMGAFHMLLQPQREGNLRQRLEEYLPLGLEPGAIFVT